MKKISLFIFIFLYSCTSGILNDSDVEYIDISKKYKVVKATNYKIKNIIDNDVVERKREKKSLMLAKKKSKKEKKRKFLSKIKKNNAVKITMKDKKKFNVNKTIKKQEKSIITTNNQILGFDNDYSYDEYKKISNSFNVNKKYPDINQIYE